MLTSNVPICNQHEKCISNGYYLEERDNSFYNGIGQLYIIFYSPVLGDKPTLRIDYGLNTINDTLTFLDFKTVYYKDKKYKDTSNNPAGYIYGNLVTFGDRGNFINFQYSDNGSAENPETPLTIYYRVYYSVSDQFYVDTNNYYTSFVPLSFWPYMIEPNFTSADFKIPNCCGNTTGGSSNCKSIIKFPQKCIPGQFYICNTVLLGEDPNYYIRIYFGNSDDDSSSPYIKVILTKLSTRFQFDSYMSTNQNKGYIHVIKAVGYSNTANFDVRYFYNNYSLHMSDPNPPDIFYRVSVDLRKGVIIRRAYASQASFDY